MLSDGTQNFSCKVLSWSVCGGGHVEYSISCTRELDDNRRDWKVSRRYADFFKLNKELQAFGMELGLPQKKFIGNKNQAFLEERKQGLQEFLNNICAHPLLYASSFAAAFLDLPDCASTDWNQWIMISIRNHPEFLFHKHWTAASWRYYKFYTLVKREKAPYLLSCVPFGLDFVGDDVDGVNSTLQFLREFDCPYISPNLKAWADSKGICVIRPLIPNGSLRDLLHKSNPEAAYLQKYGMDVNCYSMNFVDIIFIARQMLEILSLLNSLLFPFVDVHCGNVRISEHGCELLDVEFALAGQSNINRPSMIRCKHVKSLEDMMVFNFGHFLYEMLTSLLIFPDHDPMLAIQKLPREFQVMMKAIFFPPENKMPTLMDLMNDSLFRDVTIVRMAQKELEIPLDMKSLLEKQTSRMVERLNEDRKKLAMKNKLATVQHLLERTSEEKHLKNSTRSPIALYPQKDTPQ